MARVKQITSGVGVRLAFDSVAGVGLLELAQATRDRGTVVVGGYLGTDMFGYANGQPTPFPFVEAVSRNLNIRGYSSRALMADPTSLAKAKHFIADRLANGAFKPRIDRVFPLDRIEDAYAHLRAGDQVDKIVVRV